MPIVLQLDSGMERIQYPLKFNPVHLGDEYFISLVKEKWVSMRDLNCGSPMISFVEKLKSLNSSISKWEREKKFRLKKDLF